MTDTAPLDAIRKALAAVEDPEIPISLQDLGVLRESSIQGSRLRVVLVPTRLGCPAKGEMERRVRAAVRGVAPSLTVEVIWRGDRWTQDDISEHGREMLRSHGYDAGVEAQRRCPYCAGSDVKQHGSFGGSICKVPFSCRACGSTFEMLKSSVMSDLPATAGGPKPPHAEGRPLLRIV
ncbi:iron-sulfur cluster assembly protein [Pseudonocardia nigra]|uniref:iron-sulfur cluster assembly protein n=1 Tax=Pseudonocardia nigra TaxID=1921578 RepID=UPI001C5FC2EE|nr:iron-sulfur cluster assembly protein [Pseudonocardia nigra]